MRKSKVKWCHSTQRSNLSIRASSVLPWSLHIDSKCAHMYFISSSHFTKLFFPPTLKQTCSSVYPQTLSHTAHTHTHSNTLWHTLRDIKHSKIWITNSSLPLAAWMSVTLRDIRIKTSFVLSLLPTKHTVTNSTVRILWETTSFTELEFLSVYILTDCSCIPLVLSNHFICRYFLLLCLEVDLRAIKLLILES